MKVKIINNVNYHLETIESIIQNIENIVKKTPDEIHLHLGHPLTDKSFKKYITDKYSNLKLSNAKCDYNIHATFYPRDLPNFKSSDFYICHEVNQETLQYDNIFYLTPLAGKNYIKLCTMPPVQKIITNKPIYVVQGNMSDGRRNFNLAREILSNVKDLDYTIRFLGRGTIPVDIRRHPKVEHFSGLSYEEFYNKFADVYCLMPLITKSSHPRYYKNKFTTSIMYAQGYNLTTILDKELNDIYHLDNAYTFTNTKEMINCFIESHNKFTDFERNNP